MSTTTSFHRILTSESPTRRLVMGILFIALGLAIVLLFGISSNPLQRTEFTLNPGGATAILPSIFIPTNATIYVLAVVCAILGGLQIARGFKKYTTWILGVIILFFISCFLTWAAADKSLNLAGLLITTLGKSIPITLGAMAGIICERAGVWNIAIEGMMLMGAMVSCIVASVLKNALLGMLAGILAGGLIAIIHALLSIKYKVNQIISGTVINIFATGFTSYINNKFMQTYENLNAPATFSTFEIPLLSKIPFIGPILFNNNIYVYVMYIMLIVLTIILFKTRAGLRLRSVGEHPKAADTLGINVIKIRYTAVILSGMIAGFAGSYFTLGSVGRFDKVMTAGRGFIALAAMIFGNYMPAGAFSSGLLFGFADSLKDRLSILNVNIPSSFLLMAPYLATIIVLAGVVGRSTPPAAGGTPYEKESL